MPLPEPGAPITEMSMAWMTVEELVVWFWSVGLERRERETLKCFLFDNQRTDRQ